MAWDAQHRRPGVSSPWSRRGLILGDSFPRLEPKRSSTDLTMDQERALLSPIFEEQQNGFFSTPPLAVHVTIKFTDPVIRSIYSRSYESSPGFEPNNRICRGLLRRIEHCSEELITRKDSGATEGLRDGTDEPKPKRFEITFKIIRRGTGTWAERTFRSYQKQPLTVGATTEVILASHRMIGLYLRRHDKGFKWLDGSVRDHIPKGVETSSPSDNGPLSPLCIPRSQFIEASQSFEFVPGYSIEMSFRSRDPRRRPAIFARTIRVNSDQSAPLGLVTSEDLLWRAGQAIHQALEPKKQEYNDHVKDCGDSSCRHVDSDALDIQVKVANNLGPSYSHLYRNIKSKLTLFRDAEARDCKDFLKAIETAFVEARDSIDSKINEMHDFEFRILELRGVGWTLQQPAKFRIDSSVSYARRTVEAALERVQTGIADVIRGHNVAIHINAHKRGHLVLDKAIVARQKQGRPRELFESPKDQESALISRLKTRIQHDIDMVFKDTCSIDDIVDSEPEQSEDPLLSRAIDKVLSQTEKPDESVQQSITPVEVPTPQPPRAFSLNPRLISRSSKSDVCSLKSTTSASEDGNSVVGRGAQTPSLEGPAPLVINAPVKPAQRVFPLVPRSYSLPARVSSASTLVNEVQNALEGDKTTEVDHDAAEIDNAMQAPSTEKDVFEAEFAGERPALVEAVSELTSTLLPPMTSSAPNGHDASSSARMMLAEERPTTPVRDPASSPSQLETPMTQEGDAQSAAQELARSKMETPKRFKDADNSGEVTKGDLQDMLSGTRSPDADEYSTAPSTPALSSGGDSSPRHSILITPTCVRTLSGTRDPIMRELEHEFDTDELGANIGAELATAAPIVKGKEDDSRHPEVVIPIGPSSARLSPAPEIIAESELSVDEADMGSRQMKSRKGKEAPSEPAATEDPIAAENELPFKSCIASPLSEVDSGQNDRAELELAANGDKGLATPDFPTAESGLSEPNEEAAEASMSPKFTSETRSAPEKEVAVDAGVVEGPELADATDIHGVTEAGAEEIEVGHDIATAPEVSNEGQVKDAPATGAEAEPESSYLELTSKSTPQAAAEDGDASGPADSPSVDAGPEPTVQAHGGSGIGGSPEVIAEAQVIPGSDPTEYPAVSLDAEPEAHAPEVTCRPHAEACPICIEDRVPAADGAEPKPEVSNLGISDEVSAKTPEVVTEGDHDAARSEAPSDDAGAEADPMDLDTPFAIDANGSELSDAFESARTSPEGEASDTEAPEYDTEGASEVSDEHAAPKGLAVSANTGVDAWGLQSPGIAAGEESDQEVRDITLGLGSVTLDAKAADEDWDETDIPESPGADTDAEAETSTARVSDAPAAEKSDLDEVNAAASTDPEVEALNAELSDDAIAEAAEGPDTDRNGTPATELSNAEAGTKFDDSDYEILDTSSVFKATNGNEVKEDGISVPEVEAVNAEPSDIAIPDSPEILAKDENTGAIELPNIHPGTEIEASDAEIPDVPAAKEPVLDSMGPEIEAPEAEVFGKDPDATGATGSTSIDAAADSEALGLQVTDSIDAEESEVAAKEPENTDAPDLANADIGPELDSASDVATGFDEEPETSESAVGQDKKLNLPEVSGEDDALSDESQAIPDLTITKTESGETELSDASFDSIPLTPAEIPINGNVIVQDPTSHDAALELENDELDAGDKTITAEPIDDSVSAHVAVGDATSNGLSIEKDVLEPRAGDELTISEQNEATEDSVVDDLTSTDADAEPEHVEFKSSGEDIPAAAIPSVEDETTPPTLSIDDDSNISEAVIDNKDVTGGPPVVPHLTSVKAHTETEILEPEASDKITAPAPIIPVVHHVIAPNGNLMPQADNLKVRSGSLSGLREVWTSDVSEVKHAGPAPADFLPSTASTGLSAFNPALLDAFDPVHVSARSSTSSIRDLTVSGRGSVEDVVPFMDEEATRPSTSCSRPQTAGYLGLRETRRVKVGLRGALGDSRRLSLPLQYMLDEEALAAAGTRSTPSSVAGDKPRKKQIKSKKTRPVNEGEAPQKQTVKEEEGNGSDQIVPRVMMLFAGLVTVSKILKRSS